MYKLKRRLTAFVLALTVLSVNTISAFADIDKSALSSKYYDVTNEEWADNGYLNPSYFDSFGNAYDESAIPQFTYDADGNITGANDAYYNDRFNSSDLSNLKESLSDEEYENYVDSFEEYPLTLIDFDAADALSDDDVESDIDTHFAAAAAVTVAGLALCAVLVTAATGYVLSKAESQRVCEDFETHLRASGNSLVLGYLVAMISAQSLKDKLTGFGTLVKSFQAWWATYITKADTATKKLSVNSNVRHKISYSAFSPNVSAAYNCLFSLDLSGFFDPEYFPSYKNIVYDYLLYSDYEVVAFSYEYSLSKNSNGKYDMPLYPKIVYKDSSGSFFSALPYGVYSLKPYPSESFPNPTWNFYKPSSSAFGRENTYLTSDPNRYITMCEIFSSVANQYNVPFFLNHNAALNYAKGLVYDKECLYTGSASLSYNNSYKLSGDYDYGEEYAVASDADLDTLIELLQTATSEAEAISFIKQYLELSTEESATSTNKQLIANWEYIIDCFAAAGGVTDYDYATVTAAAAEKLKEADIIDLDEYGYQAEIIQISKHLKSTGSDKDPKKKTHFLKKAVAAVICVALGFELTSSEPLPDNINVISDSSALPDPDPLPNPDPDVDLNATNNILMNILTQIKALPNAISNALTDMLIGIKEAIINLPDLIQGVLAGDPLAVQQYLAQINASIDAATDAVKNIDPSGGSSGDGGGIEESGNDSDSQNILKGFVYIPFLLFVLLIIFINCMRLIVSIFNIQASTAVFNDDFIRGFDYIKSVQLPLFNITLYQLLIGGCYFCLLCLVIRVLRKRIDSIHS